MPQQSRTDDLIEALEREIQSDADAIREQVRSEIGEEGAVKVDEQEYFAYIRTRWMDQAWRQQFLEDVGPKHFWEDAHKAFGLEPQRVTKELVGDVDTRVPEPEKPKLELAGLPPSPWDPGELMRSYQ